MSDAFRRSLRTGVQVTVGLAVALPLLVHTAGIPGTLPGLGTVLAVAAAIARLMASPVVDGLLPSWLQATAPKASLPPITAAPAATVSLVADPVQAVTPVVPPANPVGGASA